MTITRQAISGIFGVILCAAAMILGISIDQASAFKLPDTGQMLCYDASGNVISCAGTGQDGAYTINPMYLHDNGNQTITDYNTGLQWQKCLAGYTNNATCDYPGPSATVQFNWYQASGTYDAMYNPTSLNVCASFGSGWRLPTNLELMSIMDYSLHSPAIQATYFPNTEYSAWTSLIVITETTEAWGVYLDGGIYGTSMSNVNDVRCVHGVQTTQSLTDNGNGTVTDHSTGLMWQQGEPGSMTRAAALNYCENLSFPLTNGFTDWRLPNIKELVSLVDYSVANYTNLIPAFNRTFFPNAVEGVYYWSSTRAIVGANTGEWVVASWDGELANGASSTSTCNVRCVRSASGGINVCPDTAPVSINGAPYSTISDAYTAATDGQSIKMQAMYFPEGALTLIRNISISLIGGYDCGYVSNLGGFSTILGSITIGGTGTVTIENVIIM